MKTKTAVALTVAVGLVIITLNIPVYRSEMLNVEEEYYFEDVNLLLIGRCRTVGASGFVWTGLKIGKDVRVDAIIGDTWLEKANIIVYNKSISDPYMSLFWVTNTYIGVHNATGVFFVGAWKQFSVGFIPFRVFILCHAEQLRIREKDSET